MDNAMNSPIISTIDSTQVMEVSGFPLPNPWIWDLPRGQRVATICKTTIKRELSPPLNGLHSKILKQLPSPRPQAKRVGGGATPSPAQQESERDQ